MRQCIRSALPEHQTCPTCRKPASEVHIRKDVAMETAVQAWKNARYAWQLNLYFHIFEPYSYC